MSVVYVLIIPIPEDGLNATMKQIRKRNKWDNDDYVYRGLILNGMSDPLLDIYQNIESFKELWDSLKAKYMIEDASSKKFLVSSFTNYKITNSRPVMKQYNELLGILGRFTQHKMNMNEAIQDSDKPKENNVAGPSAYNMVEHNNSLRLCHIHYKRIQDMSKDGLIPTFDMDTEKIDFCDVYATPLIGNKKYFVTFIDDASPSLPSSSFDVVISITPPSSSPPLHHFTVIFKTLTTLTADISSTVTGIA
nr:zinc finger, CCHC-type [Tanacetum cinerariifolium]